MAIERREQSANSASYYEGRVTFSKKFLLRAEAI